MDAQFTDLQADVVRHFARLAPPHWERIVADIEIAPQVDGFDLDAMTFAIVKRGGDLDDPQFELDGDARKAIGQLQRGMKAGGNDWSGMELVIDQPGRFDFKFSYGPPPRLNGIWDKVKAEKLDNYLKYYKAERAR